MSNFGFMRFAALFFVATVFLGPIAFAQQEVNNIPRTPPEAKDQSSQSRPSGSIYEDEEVRVRIPQGWKILKVGSPDDPLVAHPPSVAGTFIPSPGKGILLGSRGYTLTLAYVTGHASPIAGGRFPEVFTIPWPSDVWACGDSLRTSPLRSTGNLHFFSLLLDNPSREARELCGLPNVPFVNRWFAGYFSPMQGQRYFPSIGPDCPEKAYTLTTKAKTPRELPDASDAVLKRVINEAIGIVASIHYKRCSPALVSTDSL